MPTQPNNEIWIDEKTGLPMHSHTIPRHINGGTWLVTPDHAPCKCSNRECDVPLSTVRPQPTKGDH